MKYKDTTWAIVDTDSGLNTKQPIFLDYSCVRTRSDCIAYFIEDRYDSWAAAKKRGYKCVKVQIVYEVGT